MTTIRLETRIAAPAMRVFLLSLSVDLHKASTRQTGEEAIAGITTGIMGPGDTVTWRARHFGMRLTHTSLISTYESPQRFVDKMTKGAPRSFEHLHEFANLPQGVTMMHDALSFSSPLGPLGSIVDRLLLKAYLTRFLRERNSLIQEVAESTYWHRFIPSELWVGCSQQFARYEQAQIHSCK